MAVIGHDDAKRQLAEAFDSGRMHHAWLLALFGAAAFAGSDRSLRDIRSEFEARYIEYQLKRHGNNARVTAEVLGISSRQLFNKMKEYGLK